jgi:Na+-driven multidrug efflux pump
VAALRTGLRPVWQLAWPLIVAELGWMLQGVVDLMMAGPLGAADSRNSRKTLVNGVCLSLALTPVVMVALWATIPRDPPTDSIFAFAFLLVILDR